MDTTGLTGVARHAEALFTPFRIAGLSLENRLVMAPMTRCFSPGGVPGADVAAYYRRRAEGGVGLIITEGTWIPHAGASNDENVPRFYGEDALAGWKKVVDAVHAAGGRIMPQLWHVGLQIKPVIEGIYDAKGMVEPRHVGPSGIVGGIGTPLAPMAPPMTKVQIDEVREAYVSAAVSAFQLGFDGVELHAAHGYVIDQFLWEATNRRTDDYGGSFANRSRFAAGIVAGIRRATAPDFPILFRISQWKAQDYTARLAQNPQELEAVISPLVEAGVDLFDCSTRRFGEPEFAGSDLNLAGWVKKLSGVPVMTVGSVGLDREMLDTLFGETAAPASIDQALAMLERHDVDLIGVGRGLISNPDWAHKVRKGQFDRLSPYVPALLETLE
ncbi:MAG: NADH:flavin oxidoreductase [Sphingomonadaceae bacterium]